MYVCLCKSVTDHDIRAAVEDGVSCFGGMQQRLQVSTVCGACECEVKQVLKAKLTRELSARTAPVAAETPLFA